MEPTDNKTIAFTGLHSASGVTVWAYQTEADLSGINDIAIDQDEQNAPIYDLQGRRITQPSANTLYIRNGKKYFHK